MTAIKTLDVTVTGSVSALGLTFEGITAETPGRIVTFTTTRAAGRALYRRLADPDACVETTIAVDEIVTSRVIGPVAAIEAAADRAFPETVPAATSTPEPEHSPTNVLPADPALRRITYRTGAGPLARTLVVDAVPLRRVESIDGLPHQTFVRGDGVRIAIRTHLIVAVDLVLTDRERSRLLHGWAFRSHSPQEVEAIKRFLADGVRLPDFPYGSTIDKYVHGGDRYLDR